MCFLNKNTCTRQQQQKRRSGELHQMADFSSGPVQSCIEAVLNAGMKLQMTIKKFEVGIQSRTPEYQRLYRHIVSLKAQKESKISV